MVSARSQLFLDSDFSGCLAVCKARRMKGWIQGPSLASSRLDGSWQETLSVCACVCCSPLFLPCTL